jgi:hypothetical protein
MLERSNDLGMTGGKIISLSRILREVVQKELPAVDKKLPISGTNRALLSSWVCDAPEDVAFARRSRAAQNR